MKRIILLVIAIVTLVAGFGWYRNRNPSTSTLHVVTWSGYFPDSIIEEFTQKTGLKVKLSYISSNEELFSKLKAGATGYDIIFPSDYMVEQLTRLSMLQPLKKEWLPHLSHLDKYYFNLPYDSGLGYSVPFTRGSTGILVNTEKVKLPKDGEVGWEFLFSSGDPTHTSLLDEMREVFAAVLIQKGLSPNTEKVEESKVAANEIRDIKGRISLFSSEPLAPVLREDITVAHAFTTHAIQAQQTSKKFKFLFPKEGNTVWTDNYAIPVTTQKVKEAHTFIDFFLEPENALKLTLSNHLNTPNHSAWLKLEKDMREDPVLYPSDERLQKMIFLRMLDKNLLEMNALWTDVKS